jgi:hypothetical protein
VLRVTWAVRAMSLFSPLNARLGLSIT